MRRLVVLAFAVVQLLLVARILLDLGLVPSDGTIAEVVVPLSDALAAPVQGLGTGLGAFFGGPSVPGFGSAGAGIDPVMLAALAGWTVVEALVLRVVGKFAAV